MLRRIRIHHSQPWLHLFNWHVRVCFCVSLSCKSKELPLSGLFFLGLACSCRPWWLLYIARGAAGVVLVRLGSVVHLPNNLREQFVYHGFALGRGLHERAAPLLRQRLALIGRYLPLAFQVNLVPHQDHGNLLIPEDRHRCTGVNAAVEWPPGNNVSFSVVFLKWNYFLIANVNPLFHVTI